jgi:DNA polymerase-1
MNNNLELYNKYWKPFGRILTDMESRGFMIDLEHLKKIELEAKRDKDLLEQ